jgi:hypothetical protein
MHYPWQAISLLLLLNGLVRSAQAAECTHSESCVYPWGQGATRVEMYNARSAVCGSNLYQQAGQYWVPNNKYGVLTWSGGGSQQVCWDAFQNIIDQCQLGVATTHAHIGVYNYAGIRYQAIDC